MSWRLPPAGRADGRRAEDAYRLALGSPCDTCGARPGEPCRGARIERHAARLATFVRVTDAAGRRLPYGAGQVGLFGLHVDRRKHGWLLAWRETHLNLEPPEPASGPVDPSQAENPASGSSPAEAAPEASPRPGPARLTPRELPRA